MKYKTHDCTEQRQLVLRAYASLDDSVYHGYMSFQGKFAYKLPNASASEIILRGVVDGKEIATCTPFSYDKQSEVLQVTNIEQIIWKNNFQNTTAYQPKNETERMFVDYLLSALQQHKQLLFALPLSYTDKDNRRIFARWLQSLPRAAVQQLKAKYLQNPALFFYFEYSFGIREIDWNPKVQQEESLAFETAPPRL